MASVDDKHHVYLQQALATELAKFNKSDVVKKKKKKKREREREYIHMLPSRPALGEPRDFKLRNASLAKTQTNKHMSAEHKSSNRK